MDSTDFLYGYEVNGPQPSTHGTEEARAMQLDESHGWVSETGIGTCVTCGEVPVSLDQWMDSNCNREPAMIVSTCECPAHWGEPEPEVHTFVCADCRRHVPWGQGCADEHADLCDECWDKRPINDLMKAAMAAVYRLGELEDDEADEIRMRLIAAIKAVVARSVLG